MNILETKNLTIKRGKTYTLNDVSWEVKKGEHWVLYGLNGCGKTTLLSILAGFQSSKYGKVFISGEEVTKDNFLELRRQVGFVSSSFFDQYFRTEIVQDIVFAGKFNTLGLMGEIDSTDVKKAKSMLTQLGLKEKMRYPYDCLSKGQKQKVLIARALMANPQILILDEPCGGLDIISRQKFLNDIYRLVQAHGTSIIYVTHHTEEIMPFFSKAALMRDGAIYARGNIKDVFTDDILSNFFGYTSHVKWQEHQFFINLDL